MMASKIRHVLGISGGKDSAALAIYLKVNYPTLSDKIEYYFTDTGKELAETYELIDELETFLGKPINKLEQLESHKNPFDHYLDIYNGFLPSSMARWCTKKLKLEPFEKWIGDDYAISYVGIRGDEDREGYVSTKPNIQSIFPFRRHIWSIEVLRTVLHNNTVDKFVDSYKPYVEKELEEQTIKIIKTPQSTKYLFSQKLYDLLDLSIAAFNKAVFRFMSDSDLPMAKLEDYELLLNEDSIDLSGVYQLFKDNGIKVPGYYDEIEFEVNGEIGTYKRSRSGCYFCFYQQKIEWIWLYERHPEQFKLAMAYEKDGYTWMDNESLSEIIKPERITQIKTEHLEKIKKQLNKPKSNKLIDILDDGEELCANCFI
jgi:Phosphoadenosine phosphosulfate reductase family